MSSRPAYSSFWPNFGAATRSFITNATSSINATLRSFKPQNGDEQWIFLDVFEDGPAHIAGIRPGDLLLGVDGTPYVPPLVPRFKIGYTHRLSISNVRGENRRDVAVEVPFRKGTKARPPIVAPKSLVHAIIASNGGLLRILYFPGAFGMRFARALDAAVRDLKAQGCDRLVIDLRGNIGGSLGLAGLLAPCPGEIPIGHSLTPQRLRLGHDPKTLPCVPMPQSKWELFFTLARFAFRDKSVFLLTQGLGAQPFHGKIAVLVNEWTNSASEMVASFAAENHLATIVGTNTAGNVLKEPRTSLLAVVTGCVCRFSAGIHRGATVLREKGFRQMCQWKSILTF